MRCGCFRDFVSIETIGVPPSRPLALVDRRPRSRFRKEPGQIRSATRGAALTSAKYAFRIHWEDVAAPLSGNGRSTGRFAIAALPGCEGHA